MPTTKRLSDIIVGQGKPNIVPPGPSSSEAQLTALQDLLADLHDSTGSPAWNDPWISTVGDITRRGLDGVYRLKTGTSSGTVDTPGEGAIIQRDGVSPEVVGPEIAYVPIPTNDTNYPDPYLAQWKTSLGGTEFAGAPSTTKSGSSGFVSVLRKKHDPSNNDESLPGHQFSGFLAVYEKSVGDLTPATAWTRIPSGAAGTTVVGPWIDITGPNYFSLVGGETAIKKGFDLLEVTFTSGNKQVFIILDVISQTRVQVGSLGGDISVFNSADSVTLRWVQMAYSVGTETTSSTPHGIGGFVYLSPGHISDDPDSERPIRPPIFGAGTVDEARAGTDDGNIFALTWGGFTDDGDFERRGILRGDGGITSSGGFIRGGHGHRPDSVKVVPSTQGYEWNPDIYGNMLMMQFSNPTLSPVWTLTLASAYTPQVGDELIVVAQHQSGSNGQGSIVWPTNFTFSGTDDDVTGAAGDIVKFRGVYTELEGPSYEFLMTRIDY